MTTSTAPKCSTNRRCRQPVEYTVTVGSWSAAVCQAHMGLLASRLLNIDSPGVDVLTVRRISAPTDQT